MLAIFHLLKNYLACSHTSCCISMEMVCFPKKVVCFFSCFLSLQQILSLLSELLNLGLYGRWNFPEVYFYLYKDRCYHLIKVITSCSFLFSYSALYMATAKSITVSVIQQCFHFLPHCSVDFENCLVRLGSSCFYKILMRNHN